MAIRRLTSSPIERKTKCLRIPLLTLPTMPGWVAECVSISTAPPLKSSQSIPTAMYGEDSAEKPSPFLSR